MGAGVAFKVPPHKESLSIEPQSAVHWFFLKLPLQASTVAHSIEHFSVGMVACVPDVKLIRPAIRKNIFLFIIFLLPKIENSIS